MIDRRRRYNKNDWRVTHQNYLHLWEARVRLDPIVGEPWFAGGQSEYLRWFHTVARTRLRPTWMEQHIEDAPTDEDNGYDHSQSMDLYMTTWYDSLTTVSFDR